MRSTAAVFDAFGDEFEFPDYFGRNWAALDECMADLSWLEARAYAVVITEVEQMLSDDDDQLPVLLGVLDRVATEWAEAVELGEAWDRPAVPFHTILISPGRHLDEAVSAAGLTVGALTF